MPIADLPRLIDAFVDVELEEEEELVFRMGEHQLMIYQLGGVVSDGSEFAALVTHNPIDSIGPAHVLLLAILVKMLGRKLHAPRACLRVNGRAVHVETAVDDEDGDRTDTRQKNADIIFFVFLFNLNPCHHKQPRSVVGFAGHSPFVRGFPARSPTQKPAPRKLA